MAARYKGDARGLLWKKIPGRTWACWIVAYGDLDLKVTCGQDRYWWTVGRDGTQLAGGALQVATRGINGSRAAKWRCTRAANRILKGGHNGRFIPQTEARAEAR